MLKRFLFVFLSLFLCSNLFAKVDIALKEASKQALKENKLILYSVVSENCYYCKKMEKDVFLRKRILKKIEKHYVRVKVTAPQEPLADFIRVQYFPTNFILNPKDFSIIDEFPGYMKPKDFLELLELVYEQEIKQ